MTESSAITLGDLIHVKHGFAFKGEFFADKGDKLVLKPGNFPIGGGLRLRPGKDHYYTGAYPPEFELSPGDMVVVMTDLTQAAPILGSPAFIPQEPVMLHNQRLGLVQIKPGAEVDERFLYYAMLADTSRSQIRATATGATVKHTAPERIYRVSLDLPPLHTQRVIGEILGSIDELIKNSQRRADLLEEMVRTLYREWFMKFRYPGHKGISFIDSALGPIPEGWSTTTLGDSAQWFSGGTPRTTVAEYWGGKLPWITSGTLTSILLDRSDRTLTELGASNGTRVVDRDALLFVVRGMSLAKEFRVGIADTRLAFGQDVKALVASPEVEPMYLAFSVIARADDIQRMVEFAGHGTGKLSTDRLRAIEIPKPPLGLQKLFADTISPLRESMSILRLGTDHLEGLRDLLLPKLVRGQIDVSSLDLNALVGDQVA